MLDGVYNIPSCILRGELCVCFFICHLLLYFSQSWFSGMFVCKIHTIEYQAKYNSFRIYFKTTEVRSFFNLQPNFNF